MLALHQRHSGSGGSGSACWLWWPEIDSRSGLAFFIYSILYPDMVNLHLNQSVPGSNPGMDQNFFREVFNTDILNLSPRKFLNIGVLTHLIEILLLIWCNGDLYLGNLIDIDQVDWMIDWTVFFNPSNELNI